MERAANRRWIAVAALVVYAVLTGWMALHHAPWRDEADPWLVARDRSVPEILHLMGYVGSPALWYLILVPFAKLGLPYLTLGVINWVFAVAAAFLLLRSPLPLGLSVPLCFSYLFSFEYAVIARSYMLAVLLAFALAALHSTRFEHPVGYGAVLALLCNANVHGLLLAGPFLLLLGFDAWSRRRAGAPLLVGLALAGVGAGAAILQLIPPRDGQMMAAATGWRPNFGMLAEAPGEAVLPLHGGWWHLLGVIVLVAFAASLIGRWPAFWIMAASSAGLIALFVLVYAGGVRHWGFLLVAAVVACWIEHDGRSPGVRVPMRTRLGTAALGVAALAGLWPAWASWRVEAAIPFSGAREMGAYLVEHGLDDRPIVGDWPEMASAVLPYLRTPQLWYASINRWGSHMWWNRELVEGRAMTQTELFARVEAKFDDRHDVLLLSHRELAGAAAHGFRLLHAVTRSRVPDETFFLYGRL